MQFSAAKKFECGMARCDDLILAARYLPLPVLGRAVGITGEDFEVAMKAWNVVNEASCDLCFIGFDHPCEGLANILCI